VEPARAGTMPGAKEGAAARGRTESKTARLRRARVGEKERHGGGRPAGEGGELSVQSLAMTKFVWNAASGSGGLERPSKEGGAAGLSWSPPAAQWSTLRDPMGRRAVALMLADAHPVHVQEIAARCRAGPLLKNGLYYTAQQARSRKEAHQMSPAQRQHLIKPRAPRASQPAISSPTLPIKASPPPNPRKP
jgi:hypothetical protein